MPVMFVFSRVGSLLKGCHHHPQVNTTLLYIIQEIQKQACLQLR